MIRINVLTLFPEMFKPILSESIIGRALKNGILEYGVTNIRDYTLDKHRSVDDTPFGGGAGMVIAAQPVFHALESIDAPSGRIIYMSPRGKILDKTLVEELVTEERITILCGHYEGVDQRILDRFEIEEVSIGDYILTGGELPAMVLIDAVARMVPGVLGNDDAHNEESIYSGLLEYPQYTKPRVYDDMEVPEILISGHHKKIKLWNYEQSLRLTAERRPDLFIAYLRNVNELSKDEKNILDKVKDEFSVTKGEISFEKR